MIGHNEDVCCAARFPSIQRREYCSKIFIGRLDRSKGLWRARRRFMFGKVRLAQPQNRKSRYTVFPKNIRQRFGRPGIPLQMNRWKWAKLFCDYSKCRTRQRLTFEQCHTLVRTEVIRMAVQ